MSVSKLDLLKARLKQDGITIDDSLLTSINFTDKNNEGRIEYIVIHYYGSLGTAKAVAKYFQSAYREASAHFNLDEGPIVYMSVKPEDIAWHCGAKKYVHPSCRNSNSIGIEVRPYKIDTSRAKYAVDKDWYFTDEVIDNLVKFTQAVMDIYNIPKSHVIRHYDVTGKWCPRPMMGDDINTYHKKSGNQMWSEFKGRLREPMSNTSTNTNTSQVSPIKPGDKVKLASSVVQFNGNAIPVSYKSKIYTVKEINTTTGRTVLTINNVVMYAVHSKYLINQSVPATVFKDGHIPADYAKSAWTKMINKKITDGTNPTAPLTRQDFAVFADRLGLLD